MICRKSRRSDGAHAFNYESSPPVCVRCGETLFPAVAENDKLAADNIQLRDELGQMEALDGAHAREERLRAEVERLEAELARLRPVVETAEVWGAAHRRVSRAILVGELVTAETGDAIAEAEAELLTVLDDERARKAIDHTQKDRGACEACDGHRYVLTREGAAKGEVSPCPECGGSGARQEQGDADGQRHD